VAGTELAACAKNAAVLAAAAAGDRAAKLAGAAAAGVFSEVHELALASGGRSETFAGLAGAGDLVATVVAESSRNRRAVELVGQGVPSHQGSGIADQTPESLATVPLLDLAFERRGIDAPVTVGLGELLEGRISPDEWVETLRSPAARRPRRAA
jgi:glycerol-3-phosphate dehydrogenase (NAD(P)+)